MLRMLISGTTYSVLNIAKLYQRVQPTKILKLGACIAPVLLMDLPLTWVWITAVLMQLMHAASGCTLFGFTYGLPTLAATTVLNRLSHTMSDRERMLWAGWCIAGAGAFSLLPAVGYGWMFGMYWLIPALLLVYWPHALISHALIASLIAHLVGSWCYVLTVPSTPALWAALIPVVALERLQYAAMLAAGLWIRYQVRHSGRSLSVIAAHLTTRISR